MTRKTNIVLLGMPGAGKTTVSKELLSLLSDSFRVVDTDEVIEKEAGRSISAIFKEEGEKFFRDLEQKIVEETAGNRNQIISTGGGVVVREKNIEILKQSGMLFYLKTDVNTLGKRLFGNITRPLLEDKNKVSKLKELLKSREKNYEKADLIILTDNKSPIDIAKEIVIHYEK